MSLKTMRVKPAETARTFGVGHFRRAYEQGINVSQLLEREDPTSEYSENSEDRQLDAFERVMREAGIVTAPMPEIGLQASTYEDATRTREQRALMVEHFSRIWRQTRGWMRMTPSTGQSLASGSQRAILLSGDAAVGTLAKAWTDDLTIHAKRLVPPVPLAAIVSGTRNIQGDALRTLYITDDFGTDAYRMKRVMEGGRIPTTTMITGEHTLRIHKFGRGLRSTYEQLRRERIDRVGFLLARMTLQTEVDMVAIAIEVLVNGDGNANTAAVVLALTALDPQANAGDLTLNAWLLFKLRFGPAYRANVVLGQEAGIMQLLQLPTYSINQPAALMNAVPAIGGLVPIDDLLSNGVRYGVTSDAPALKLVAFDNTIALQQVNEIGGNVSETERFIENQTQMITMTETTGFEVQDPYSSRVLDINS